MSGLALVTGANRGIGFAVARGLCEHGLTVLLGARDGSEGEKAARTLADTGGDARPIEIDIADDASVAGAAAAIDAEFGALDVLVNNAGVKYEFHPAPPSQASLDVVRETYRVNVFGTMSVTLAMLPLLKRAAAGRIVNVSSGLSSMGLASVSGSKHAQKAMLSYNTSKAAINSVTIQFANELRDTPIKVNSADPGYTKTDMTHFDGNRSPEQAAQVIIRLATLGPDGPSGCFFDNDGALPW